MTQDPGTINAQSTEDRYCLGCGYNQRGITSDRCPECGQLYAKTPPSPLRIPWLHRKYLGRLAAYWLTIRLVLFRREQFGQEIAHPVSYSEARGFWLVTIAHAYLPFPLAVGVLHFALPAGVRNDLGLFTWIYAPVWPVCSWLVGLLLFITFATGLPSYFCYRRQAPIEKQNRAIALSYYASAPLALMPPVVATLTLAAVLIGRLLNVPGYLAVLAGMLALLVLGGWWFCTCSIIARLTARDPIRLGGLLLLFWLLLAVLFLVITPVLIHYTILLIYAML